MGHWIKEAGGWRGLWLHPLGLSGVLLFGLVCGLGVTTGAWAADLLYGPPADIYSANDFGGIGLLNTRTARFAPDGTMEAGATFVNPYRRFYLTWQIFPWLEATFRYTDPTNDLVSGGIVDQSQGTFFSNIFKFKQGGTNLDRGAGIKIRLMRESRIRPALALGLQDSIGTGRFQGEYLVATKRYRDFDITLGMGWGYFASRGTFKNPFRLFSKRFASRGGGSRFGGTPLFGNFFSGAQVGLFGGVEYFTPIEGLSAKFEFNPADPAKEPRGEVLAESLPVGFGINYRANSWTDLSLGFERGNSLMMRIGFRYNLHKPGVAKFDPPPPPLHPRKRGKGDTDEGDPNQESKQPNAQGPGDQKLYGTLASKGFRLVGLHPTQGTADIAAKVVGAAQAACFDPPDTAFYRDLFSRLPVDVSVLHVHMRGASRERDFMVSRRTVREWAKADRVIETLRREGFSLQSLNFENALAEFRLASETRDSAIPETTAQALARQFLVLLPPRVERLGLKGVTAAPVRFNRDDLAKAVLAARLGTALGKQGFPVTRIDVHGAAATVRLAAPYWGQRNDYRDLSRMVLSISSDFVRRVTLVGERAGLEVARLTAWARPSENFVDRPPVLERATAGLTAGAETQAKGNADAPDEEIARKIFADLARNGFYVSALHMTDLRATVYVQGIRFREQARNIGWIVRVVSNYLPPGIEDITLVTIIGGMEISRVSVIRKDFENAVEGRGSPEEILLHARFEKPKPGLKLPEGTVRAPSAFPAFRWNVRPTLQQSVGDPSTGLYLADVNATLALRYDIVAGLALRAVWEQFLFGNLDKITRNSDSLLPRVRSDIRKYLQTNRSALVRLQADYLFSPASDVYARLSAGIFERNFGGVGGEILYRPHGKRWAIGGDLNWVKQRDFEERLDFRAYEVVTGQVTLNYELPYYNLLATVDVGRYLAKDVGATFTISREFDSGIRVGAWATKTNVSAAEFGEGSFDKGFFISFPLQVFMTHSTRDSAIFAFRPLTRDGGQKLIIGPKLYDVTREGNTDNVIASWGRVLD